MEIAYVKADGPGGLDGLLAELAQMLANDGLRTAGVVQINTDRGDCNPCDMDVRVLPDGPDIRISQTLGAGAKGCRLDPSALEEAVGRVMGRLSLQTDVLLVNKFGKHEADGRGFREPIATALSLGIPVICGVNGLNRDAFLDFAGDLAVQVAPDPAALRDWLRACPRNAA